MEIKGRIKSIDVTKTYGSNGFRKRELILITDEQYPQQLAIEFIQDKCDVLNAYKAGRDVEIGINLKGREWTNPEGEVKYFNSIQGWRIDDAKLENTSEIENIPQQSGKAKVKAEVNPIAQEDDDLPF